MSPIAFKQIRISDLTGEVVPDENVVEVVIRAHPDLDDAKRFDASPGELKDLVALENIVELELRSPSGAVGTMLVEKDQFNEVIPLEKAKAFDSTRGRRSGYRPNGS